MYQNKNKGLCIMALFLGNYAKQFYLREISKLTGIPLKTTQNLLADLEKEKLVKGEVRGKNKYFRLNLDNIKTKLCLLQAEAHKTARFIEAYPLFKAFLKALRTNAPIIVFGSFAGFKAGKDSDVDLLILSKEKQTLPSYLLPYTLHEIEMSESSFTKSLEKQETLIKEIEEKHIILNNHSFYVNAMWSFYGK